MILEEINRGGGVFQQVAGKLGHNDGNMLYADFIELQFLAHRRGQPPGFAHMTRFIDPQSSHILHFHFTTVTRVPSPGTDQISNSFTNRFEPLSPRPKPLPPLRQTNLESPFSFPHRYIPPGAEFQRKQRCGDYPAGAQQARQAQANLRERSQSPS